ncbi:MAG: hypothetical protein GY780_13045 [bacterium]|nr:hypothetical protein [bacterium]
MQKYQSEKSVSRVKARSITKANSAAIPWGLMLAVAAATLLLVLFSVSTASAQFPRLGLSGAPDHYVDSMDVELGQVFTIYIVLFGIDEASALDQELSMVSWVLQQVCCGAALVINHTEYNADWQHEGHPTLGVVSSSEVCVDEPAIVLATMTATMIADEDGEYLAASGPYQQPVDCDGENPVIMGLPMTFNLSGVSPTEDTTWDSLKSFYR